MEKFFEELGLDVSFCKANPLSASEPPVPDLCTQTVLLAKGSVHAEGAYPLPCDIVMEQDVAVPLRDGTVLWADVYRPVTEEPVPVILAYTPYCKRSGWWNTHYNATRFGVPAGDLSGLQAFESPDPGYWCNHGYAVAVVDAAGTSHSGGDQAFIGTADGRNAYDTIEWLAAQDWCSGKVGMAGNSYLALIQFAAAALRPPHLAALAPWEGNNDIYRGVIVRGGIPDTKFHNVDIVPHIYGENYAEDVANQMLERFPLMNAYWVDKWPALERITLPAYVVASWTSVIHTYGTLQAFRQLASPHKWLRIHNNQEWLDGPDPNSIRDLLKFFDRYLKDIDNDWEDTPRVRLSVLDPGGTDVVGRPEENWPLPRQQWQTLFLDAASGSLSDKEVQREAVAEYDGDDLDASVTFSTTFDRDIEITGYLNLHLWVEAADAQDMDLFAAVFKESADGKLQQHLILNTPGARPLIQHLQQSGALPALFIYTGPLGRLRVSHRALDPDRSTPYEPFLSHTSEDLLTPGECVPVELSLWPTSMLVHAGERLVVKIAGHPVGPQESERQPGGPPLLSTRNRGKHRIRTGGQYDSHLLLPVVP